jgi:Ser/Thr protein kinase RdoA (MazF antagonist)
MAHLAPHPFTGEIVSHNDPNLDNIIFRNGRAVALIDFDLASPGSRVWDVACAARLWAPLRPEAYITDDRRGREFARLRTFVDGYGLNPAEKAQLLSAVEQNQKWFNQLVTDQIAAGACKHNGVTPIKETDTCD